MIDRINLILKAKNITARQFAEEIGIQPSGMSHILSGRNRPSLDFVLKVINRYPEIDINWLMFGKGEMIVPPIVSPVKPEPVKPASTPGTPSSPWATKDQTFAKTPAQKIPVPELDLFSSVEDFSDLNDSQSDSAVPPTPSPMPMEEPANDTAVEVPNKSFSSESDYEEDKQAVRGVKNAPLGQLNENGVKHIVKPYGDVEQNVVEKKIAKVVILYTDHSFSEYYPEK